MTILQITTVKLIYYGGYYNNRRKRPKGKIVYFSSNFQNCHHLLSASVTTQNDVKWATWILISVVCSDEKVRLVDDKMIQFFIILRHISINFRNQSYNYIIFICEPPIMIEVVFFFITMRDASHS